MYLRLPLTFFRLVVRVIINYFLSDFKYFSSYVYIGKSKLCELLSAGGHTLPYAHVQKIQVVFSIGIFDVSHENPMREVRDSEK